MGLDIQVYNDIYYSESFKVIVRSCKEHLLAGAQELVIADRSFMYAHRNNFHTLLRGMGIDDRLIWPVAFINDILDPSVDFMEKQSIYVCTLEQIEALTTQLKTKRKVA